MPAESLTEIGTFWPGRPLRTFRFARRQFILQSRGRRTLRLLLGIDTEVQFIAPTFTPEG